MKDLDILDELLTSKRPPPVPWTLEAAIPVLRRIEEQLLPLGYHCAIGGSVLHAGHSEKDLDVFVYPHDAKVTLPPEEILKTLFNGDSCFGECDANYQARDPKTVFWLYTSDQRIDFFFLS